jgi:micrococcal nuclease
VRVRLVISPDFKSKTPSVQTLGVLLFGFYWFAATFAMADCMPSGAGETALVTYVYDGDTLKLNDGRRLRVLGINAPEIDHGEEQTGQSLGEESRRAALAFFKSDKTVRLFYDQQLRDRYGRTLAHIYDAQGNSLGAHLLRSGLAFHVAVPPNMSLNDCFIAQEAIARRKGLGVWGDPAWRAKPAMSLKREDRGFQRIIGRVLDVKVSQSVSLELEGLLVINIPSADLKRFPAINWKAWSGKSVEVRGWVTERKPRKSGKRSVPNSFKPLVIQPRIASNLELLD